MLHVLRIKNYAIIDTLDLTAEPGLTVFTGETGAGKTIIVEAIRFLLGGRVSSDMVRTGADTAVVEAEFDGLSEQRKSDDSIPQERFWLRRELSARGTSRAFLNDEQIKIAELQKIGDHLADLCGQHQQQQLLNASRHVELIDRAANTLDRVARLRESWSQHQSTVRALAEAKSRRDRSREQADLRQFQIDEIRNAGLTPNEDEQLSTERSRLRHLHRLLESTEHGLSALIENDESVDTVLSRLTRDAERLCDIDGAWTDITERLVAARDTVHDVIAALSDYRSSLDVDPRRLDEVEARLAELHRLKMKYGESCVLILERLAELESEEHNGDQLGRQIVELETEVKRQQHALIDLAVALSDKRHSAASALEKQVNSEVTGLGMAGSQVRVSLEKHTDGGIAVDSEGQRLHIHEDGLEEIRLQFEANPKEGFKPLDKIASGGELSRLLLAFKSAAPQATDSRLTIFDEIDSGVGGETAHKVAARIAKLAKHGQVFLVSHLQQMAAVADRHYRIIKTKAGGRATVRIEKLGADDRVREMARMVAGDRLTDRTLDYASELISSSQDKP